LNAGGQLRIKNEGLMPLVSKSPSELKRVTISETKSDAALE
jgi:hypothetical protein